MRAIPSQLARFWIALYCLLMALTLTPVAIGQSGGATVQPCVLGYTVGFFNGVWNTRRQGQQGLNAIHAAISEATGTSSGVYNKEDIAYELFYNQTGSATGTGNTGLQDLAEVFIQRMDALDSTGNLATDAVYMFWDAANGITTFHQPLSQANSEFDQLFTKFVNDALATALGEISKLLSAPPTAADYRAQEMQLTADANDGRKLLLVAHSQGNIFVNHGYDFIEPSITLDRVKVVHIAPASSTLRGAWTLSTNDQVINALGKADGGTHSVPMTTVTIPSSSTDKSGHTLIGTYLTAEVDRSQGRTAIETQLLNALSNLASSSTCNATILPATSVIKPGGTTTLTATVAPPVADTTLTTFYRWTVSGNAGGVLTGSAFGSTGTTYISSTPSVTYTASTGAPQGSSDTVTAAVLVGVDANNSATAKQIGTGTASIAIQSGVTYTYTGLPYVQRYCEAVYGSNFFPPACAMGSITGTMTFSIPQGYTGKVGASSIVSASFTANGITRTLNWPIDPKVELVLYDSFLFQDGVPVHYLFSIGALYPNTDGSLELNGMDIADRETHNVFGFLGCDGGACSNYASYRPKGNDLTSDVIGISKIDGVWSSH